MLLKGEFLSAHGDRVRVEIENRTAGGGDIEIGAPGSGVRWTSSPVEICSESNDTSDILLRQSATVRLDSNRLLPELYSTVYSHVTVKIWRAGECVFAGYVEPQTYSQPFRDEWDEVEVNCIDMLSALQYEKFRHAGTEADFTETLLAAGSSTFHTLIADALGSADMKHGGSDAEILYDGSRMLPAAAGGGSGEAGAGGEEAARKLRRRLFHSVEVSDHLFLGKTEDEVWTQEDVLTEVLRYLNLHVRQEGFSFRIFSWEQVKSGGTVKWLRLSDMGDRGVQAPGGIALSTLNVADSGTTLSIGEVYNRISVSCAVMHDETLVTSPLDVDSMKPAYPSMDFFMREYISESRKKYAEEDYDAAFALVDMWNGEPADYDGAKIRDWYVRVQRGLDWSYNTTGIDDFINRIEEEGYGQTEVAGMLRTGAGAALLSFGKVDIDPTGKDTSPVGQIHMTDYLTVGVNGNGKDADGETWPTEASLRDDAPLAVYTGPSATANYSPGDDETTNYIVVSGRVLLTPLPEWTDDFPLAPPVSYESVIDGRVPPRVKIKRVASRQSDQGRFWLPVWSLLTGKEGSLMPPTGDGPQQMEFRHSAVGDSTDRVKKVGVLACMLVIGDKCVVETGTEGKPSDFEWRPYKERGECSGDEEYYAQSFTIGFDPKIGDSLIGTEFPMQNNISVEMGLSTEGMAIPVRRSDKVAGKVRFMILGPVNVMWGEVTRRHKTWFRRARWSGSEIPLMAHVASVFVSDFKMEVVSDNALTDGEKTTELLYMSAADSGRVTEREPVTFHIVSALTKEERDKVGIREMPSPSTPVISDLGENLLEITDTVTGSTGKPERLYIDRQWAEWHAPRVRLTVRLQDKANNAEVSPLNHYTHPALPGKRFFVTGVSRNLTEGWAELELKEIDL